MYQLRIIPDSFIKPQVPKDKYNIRCKCDGLIVVQKMMQAVTCKEGWLATCKQCHATSGIQETHIEAEGRVISNALEKINDARDQLKALANRKKAFVAAGGILKPHKEY